MRFLTALACHIEIKIGAVTCPLFRAEPLIFRVIV